MTTFHHPDFAAARLAGAPDARFVPAPADGVLPDGFFTTTNLPTYVRVAGGWRLPAEPRMDAALVLDPAGELWAREGRRVRAGDRVAVGQAEDGSQGMLVHATVFAGEHEAGDEFQFMTSAVSREKPIDYGQMARLLVDERERGGYPVWVAGPAMVHSRARADMTWFVRNGFVGACLAGNAVAVHDIEASTFGTTLGMTGTGQASAGGPLPEVLTAAVAAQDAMRGHTTRATMAVLVATALHAIATGNMLPAFVMEDPTTGRPTSRPHGTSPAEWPTLRGLPTICVDSSDFVVSKLKDRGTHQAFGVVTNAQDFLHILRLYVERELDARGATTVPSTAAEAAHA